MATGASRLNDAVPVLSGSVEVARSAILENFFDDVMRISGPDACMQGVQERRGASASWAGNRRTSAPPHPHGSGDAKPQRETRYSVGFAAQSNPINTEESPRDDRSPSSPLPALGAAASAQRQQRSSCIRSSSQVQTASAHGASPDRSARESTSAGPTRRVRFAEGTEPDTNEADTLQQGHPTPRRTLSRTCTPYRRGEPAGASRTRSRSFIRPRAMTRSQSVGRVREMPSGTAAMPFHSPEVSAELTDSPPMRPCLPILTRAYSNGSADTSESLPPPPTPTDSTDSTSVTPDVTACSSDWYSGELRREQRRSRSRQSAISAPHAEAGYNGTPLTTPRPSAGTSPDPYRLHMESRYAAARQRVQPGARSVSAARSQQAHEFEAVLHGACGAAPAVLTPFDTMPAQRMPCAAVAVARNNPSRGASADESCDYSSSGASVTSTMLADEGSVSSALCAADVENGMRFLSDDVTESPSYTTSSHSSDMDCAIDGASGDEATGGHMSSVAWNPPEASPPLYEAVTIIRRLWWIQVHAEEQEQLRSVQRMHHSSLTGNTELVDPRVSTDGQSGALTCEMFAIDGLDE